MSQNTYRYGRLDGHYQRLVEAKRTDDVRAQNSILNRIIVDCWALGIAAISFLQRKDRELEAAQVPIVAASVATECICPGCGKDFGSKQARGAHTKYCQKGGKAHD